MPSFFTHYIFGVESYRRMASCELKEAIRKHTSVYTLGEQGPDLFFYLMKPDSGHDIPLGTLLHEYDTGEFFKNLLLFANSRKAAEREICYTYIAGFLGHYRLDVQCHPFVYERAGVYEGMSDLEKKRAYYIHFALEADMDQYYLKHHLHKTLKERKNLATRNFSREETKVLKKLLSSAFTRTYRTRKMTEWEVGSMLKASRWYGELLKDSLGFKETVLGWIEKSVWGTPVYSVLFRNEKEYETSGEDRSEFQKRYQLAKEQYMVLLEKLAEVYELCDAKEQMAKLLCMIGNDSYHTGKISKKYMIGGKN